jgi:acetyltransferase-like isoleucine patch superfamily enzyme
VSGIFRKIAYGGECELGARVRFLPSAMISNARQQRSAIRVGNDCVIGGELLTFGHGGELRLGDWCYVGACTRIWSASSIDIGNRVLISHNVNIHDCDSHPLDPGARHRQFQAIARSGHPKEAPPMDARSIRIEDDVWIGFNCTILKGVTIGARSVIAAGSTVTKQIPPDSLVIGGEVRKTLA